MPRPKLKPQFSWCYDCVRFEKMHLMTKTLVEQGFIDIDIRKEPLQKDEKKKQNTTTNAMNERFLFVRGSLCLRSTTASHLETNPRNLMYTVLL
jgi:hypothetical protein